MSPPSFREEKGRGDFFAKTFANGVATGTSAGKTAPKTCRRGSNNAIIRRSRGVKRGTERFFSRFFAKTGVSRRRGGGDRTRFLGNVAGQTKRKNAQVPFVKRVANIGERREKRLARFGDLSYNASRESAGGSAIRRLNERLTLKNKGLRLTAAVEIAASDERAGREDDDGE